MNSALHLCAGLSQQGHRTVPILRRVVWPLALAVLVAATFGVGRLGAQDASQEKTAQAEIDALRKQVKMLQKEIEELRKVVEEKTVEAARERQRHEELRKVAEERFRQASRVLEELFRQLDPREAQPPAAEKERLKAALKAYREALEKRGQEKDGKEEPGKEQLEKAQTLQRKADEQMKAGQLVEAEATYQQAIQLRQKLVVDFPAVPVHRLELARMNNSLGEMHTLTGRYKKAEPPLRKATALLEKLAAEVPDSRMWGPELVRSYQQLGQLYQASGKAKQAKEMLQKAKVLERSLDKESK
ncbi:MAG TPA: hypothetical protein VEL76_15745 [Gemmataceae bacterium]|nr:hypothetical protein [Gemmataceae bacterium]